MYVAAAADVYAHNKKKLNYEKKTNVVCMGMYKSRKKNAE